MSPNEALRTFIDKGWGKTTLSRPEVLALAFAEEVERMPDRGRVSYTPRRGETMYFYADELLGYDHKITLRVPAYNPEFVFCFADGELICQAFPEQTYGVLDGEGAHEVNRRGKAFRRQIAEKRQHVSLLSLTDETERHITHTQRFAEDFAGMSDRSITYWELLADHTATKTREIGRVSGYERAAIERVQVRAQIDEGTTEICRQMDGRIIEVTKMRAQVTEYLDAVSVRDEPRAKAAWALNSDEDVDLSDINDEDLDAAIASPPYHFRCRTITVAYFG